MSRVKPQNVDRDSLALEFKCPKCGGIFYYTLEESKQTIMLPCECRSRTEPIKKIKLSIEYGSQEVKSPSGLSEDEQYAVDVLKSIYDRSVVTSVVKSLRNKNYDREGLIREAVARIDNTMGV